jgi:hypothetical protein
VSRRAFSAKDALQLPDADPARVWVFVADLFNLPRWTAARKVEAAPELPVTGDMLSAVHRFVVIRYRVQYEVADWEAGRRFRLAMSGLPFVEDAEMECRVESVVEPDRPVTAVELRMTGTASPWLVGPMDAMAARQVASSLRKLEKEFG